MRRRGGEDVTEMSGWLYADLLLGLAVVFLVAVPFAGIADTEAAQCPTVVVPDVVEMSIDEAADAIEMKGLVAKRVPKEQQGVAEKEVYLQEPTAGTRVCEESEVRLTYNLVEVRETEPYSETFKIVLKTQDAAQLGSRLQLWIAEQGIRRDSFVNVALVYGHYTRGSATQGSNSAKLAFSQVVQGCQEVDSCKGLEPLGRDRPQTREARFFGTQGEPLKGWTVRSGEFFVEMFIVCPDKCKG